MQINCSNINFKGIYKFDANKDADMVYPYFVIKDGQNEDFDFCEKPNYQDMEKLKQGIWGQYTVVADDKYDKEIEALLTSKGINFKRTSLESAFDFENIFNRIKLSDEDKIEDRKLVVLDVDKVEDLFSKDSDMYIGKNGKNGISNRYNNFINYLKTDTDIDASKIVLSERDGKLTLSFMDGRHRFSVLRDMGMKKIPFSLDEDSFKMAQKYGLVSE